MLEEIIDGLDGKISDLAIRTIRHDDKVLSTCQELKENDENGVYECFVDDYVPKGLRGYVGHYTREYDIIRRTGDGVTTDVFEVKTNHTPKGYVKAVKQLSYAHLLNNGIDTWYVSWRKDKHGGGRIVRPVWMKDDWDGMTSVEDLYNPSKNRELYDFKNTLK